MGPSSTPEFEPLDGFLDPARLKVKLNSLTETISQFLILGIFQIMIIATIIPTIGITAKDFEDTPRWEPHEI